MIINILSNINRQYYQILYTINYKEKSIICIIRKDENL